MMLWIGFAVMTALALVALVRPLVRARATRDASAADVAVYKDQLAEVERDVASGLLSAQEAEAARVEIARRLLSVAEGAGATSGNGSGPAVSDGLREGAAADQAGQALSRTTAMALLVGVPLASIGLYAGFGSPFQADAPLAARDTRQPIRQAGPGQPSIQSMIARVEARLRANPDDARGWAVIAPIYMRLRRFADAASAYKRLMALKGETPPRLSAWAEARVLGAGGRVSDEVMAAFERIAKAEPKHMRARFWLAVAAEQRGQRAKAIAGYEALVAGAPENAAWLAPVKRQLARLRAASAAPSSAQARAPTPAPAPAGGPQRGPTAEDVDAARTMTPKARAAMINAMVAGLADRLRREGGDLADWQKLIRAYVVLKKSGEAQAALARARKRFADDETKLARLTAFARDLGLGKPAKAPAGG